MNLSVEIKMYFEYYLLIANDDKFIRHRCYFGHLANPLKLILPI